jgi:hypothetical protein
MWKILWYISALSPSPIKPQFRIAVHIAIHIMSAPKYCEGPGNSQPYFLGISTVFLTIHLTNLSLLSHTLTHPEECTANYIVTISQYFLKCPFFNAYLLKMTILPDLCQGLGYCVNVFFMVVNNMDSNSHWPLYNNQDKYRYTVSIPVYEQVMYFVK